MTGLVCAFISPSHCRPWLFLREKNAFPVCQLGQCERLALKKWLQKKRQADVSVACNLRCCFRWQRVSKCELQGDVLVLNSEPNDLECENNRQTHESAP